MDPKRAVELSLRKPTHAVCVVGVEMLLDVYSDVPHDAKIFGVSGSSGVNIRVVDDPTRATDPTGKALWSLDPKVDVAISVDAVSKNLNDLQVTVSYFGKEGKATLGQSELHLTAIDVSLDVDVDRTGKVKKSRGDKKTWQWGPEGRGAILLVNCDKDASASTKPDLHSSSPTSLDDLQDMSPMVLTCDGPDELFSRHQLVLDASLSDASRVRVFLAPVQGRSSLSAYKQVVGPQLPSYQVARQPGQREITFYVEGLAFPDAEFSGLVYINVTLGDTKVLTARPLRGQVPRGGRGGATLEVPAESSCPTLPRALPKVPLFRDTVAFHVAPWIMTPNTQQPLDLYVCSVTDVYGPNEKFVDDLRQLVQKAGCNLVICPQVDNRNDRWIQDEMEFGYIEAPHKSFPVVFDSPRNRGLEDFPIKKVLGPDFGYVTREISGDTTNLDSFGNLDVSPPVTVRDKQYPLGRILFGGNLYNPSGRQMAKKVRDFLFAQRVQAPVELYSEWLRVGHVDEFLSFVPTSDPKGFRLLLASPSACLKLFREKKQQGHGKAAQFDGEHRRPRHSATPQGPLLPSDQQPENRCLGDGRSLHSLQPTNERGDQGAASPGTGVGAGGPPGGPRSSGLSHKENKTINDLLDSSTFREHNFHVQECIDWNREVLKRELGLVEADIIDIPQLFVLNKALAEAFFPNMVNMLVLGKHLAIPKPFGPIINGRCCLEEKVRSLLEPLGLHCTFIDDYLFYHTRSGEIHCGTNVRRKPFAFKWWHMVP
ncbi:protein-arginine deiminase type-1 [Ctenodactylus gundi]